MRKFILWVPRVLAIVFILFISMFALDAFTGDMPWWEKVVGFLIHLIPTYILIGFLLLAWRYPLVGGLLFIGIGVFYILWAREFDLLTYVIVSGPAILTGALFAAQNFLIKE